MIIKPCTNEQLLIAFNRPVKFQESVVTEFIITTPATVIVKKSSVSVIDENERLVVYVPMNNVESIYWRK